MPLDFTNIYKNHAWFRENRKWSELTFTQKKHKIYITLKSTRYVFWNICGKDAQKKYVGGIQYTEENIEQYVDEIVDLYKRNLLNSNVKKKLSKMIGLARHLGREITDYEKQEILHIMESNKE